MVVHTHTCTHTYTQQLPKKSFLCLTNYSEPYFDFHCLTPPQGPAPGSSHYTVCGTPYENAVEYQLVVVGTCLLGLAFFYQVLLRSGRDVKPKKDASSKDGKMKKA